MKSCALFSDELGATWATNAYFSGVFVSSGQMHKFLPQFSCSTISPPNHGERKVTNIRLSVLEQSLNPTYQP
jgi:hypothetical protein